MVRAKSQKRVIVAGDFNAKSPIWGSSVPNNRGEVLLVWMAALGLTIHNVGNEPTCVRHNGYSHIDITLSNERAADEISEWEVLGVETLSDHRCISFRLDGRTPIDMGGPKRRKMIPLNAKERFKTKLIAEVGSVSRPPVDTIGLIQDICREFTIVRQLRGRPVYWWNREIAGLRGTFTAKRRMLIRSEEDERTTRKQ